MKTSLVLLAAAIAFAGCANRPDTIRASFVSHEKFTGLDCVALGVRLSGSQRELLRVSKLQDEKANADAVGVFLLGVPFSKLSGDHEGEVARVKGEIEALETAQTKNCAGDSRSVPRVNAQAPNTGLQFRLEQLRSLYNAGLINFDEYEAKRKQILSDL